MEKKLLTEILRIKELIGGKNLLTEETLPVKILQALSSIFKNESDDVVKKIISSNDNLVTKLKNGNLNPKEADLIIKNAGGLEVFYYKTARETFNQKNYKDFYTDFQTLKNTGTMDKMYLYSVIIDQDIPKLLPNAGEGYRTEMKNMLKDELRTYIDNKTKTNPFLQDDVPNKKNPSLETPNNKKVEEPISSGEETIKGGSFLDNISFDELNNVHEDYVFGTGEEFNKFMKKLLEGRKKKIDKKHWGDIESQFTHEIEMLYKKAGEPFPTEIKEQATFAINKLNTMKNIAQKEKIINDTLNKLKDTITVKDSNSILIINRFKEYVLNGGPKGGVGIDEFYRKCIIASSLMSGANLVLRVSTGLNNFDIETFKEDAKWNIAKSLIHFVPGLNVISSFQSLIFSIWQAFAKLFKDDEMTLKEKSALSLFKGALELAGMPSIYSPNVQFDTNTKKFMYHHPDGIKEIYDVGALAKKAYIRGKPTKAYPDGKINYLTQFK